MMLTRRVVLTAGAALAGAVLPPNARPLAAERGLPLYTHVFDSRFPESVAFARKVASEGRKVSAILGDVTRLWHEDLRLQWAQAPVAIVGLTDPEALFCLETLGADVGLIPVFKTQVSSGPLIQWALARAAKLNAPTWARRSGDAFWASLLPVSCRPPEGG